MNDIRKLSIKDSSSGLFDNSRKYLLPFRYKWAYESWQAQQQMHWLPEEVSMTNDVYDWKYKLTDGERSLLTQIFSFFTQSDIAVHEGYLQHYMNVFTAVEIKMMLTAFANMETVHIAGYSYLIETLRMPESTYSTFLEYQEMKDKWEYCINCQSNDLHELAISLATISIITEGILLFSSFAILASFGKNNKMKGMCQIISWSIRDETLHNKSMTKLFNVMMDDHPFLWTQELKEEIKKRCMEAVDLEDRFIDLAFGHHGVSTTSPEEIKKYIRFLADIRLQAAGINKIYGVNSNEISDWLHFLLYSKEHVNFFDNRATDYSKAALKGDWDQAFDDLG